MPTIAALLLLAFTAVAAQAAPATSIRRLDGTRLSFAEASRIARETLAAQQVTGAQIAIVDRGHLVWSEAFGTRSVDPERPMERTTTTWAGSITKGLFATYVMQLAERGGFDLDLPIVRQLPQPLDRYEPYRDIASPLVEDPRWPRVTPRMLLAHTSGLYNFAFLEPDKKLHLHAEPGAQFRYSGEGMNLLQFVIEQKTQRPLQELMEEAIFRPAGMPHTSLIFRSGVDTNIADRFDAAGKFHAKTRRSPARAAGSMTSTAEDLAHFCEALFADKLLKPATRRTMLTPAIAIRSLHQFALGPNEPEGDEAQRVGLAYGAGWGLLTHTKFGPAFFKEGHGDGAQNYLICFERRQACMIVLTNNDNGELAFRHLFESLLGDTVTPWEWEGYTPSFIELSRKNGN
jgi:CubicO group peptidase (beta-lactamase class C family)